MSVKCAILEYDYENPAPSYKDLDVNLSKTGKVLYGGGKRKSKSTPYLDKLSTIEYAFNCFSELLFPLSKDNYTHYFELYLFDRDAHETMLYLKYPQTITHFVIDDGLIDALHHLEWSYQHLVRYMRDLEGTANSLNFYIEKDIGDKRLHNAFPSYIKANDKLQEAIVNASQRIVDNAGLILKSGW